MGSSDHYPEAMEDRQEDCHAQQDCGIGQDAQGLVQLLPAELRLSGPVELRLLLPYLRMRTHLHSN